MKIVYSKHAQGKLKRSDIIRFGISKRLIRKTISEQSHQEPTKYGAWAGLLQLNGRTLRVIYARISKEDRKIITFHIAKKGRYERKILQGR